MLTSESFGSLGRDLKFTRRLLKKNFSFAPRTVRTSWRCARSTA